MTAGQVEDASLVEIPRGKTGRRVFGPTECWRAAADVTAALLQLPDGRYPSRSVKGEDVPDALWQHSPVAHGAGREIGHEGVEGGVPALRHGE